jgi:hypothetical protein
VDVGQCYRYVAVERTGEQRQRHDNLYGRRSTGPHNLCAEQCRANNDPNAPGIGKYHWAGTYTTDIAEFFKAVQRIPGAAPQLATASEEFYFPDTANSIITGGEWPNAFFTLLRPVLGGTGHFRYRVGETKRDQYWGEPYGCMQPSRDLHDSQGKGGKRTLRPLHFVRCKSEVAEMP